MALASRWLQRRRLEHVTPFLRAPILDVGCGNGVAHSVAGEGYVGIDRDPTPLTPSGYVAFQRTLGSADALPFKDGSFQTVLAMAVLEHVADPAGCLSEVMRVLRPGGRLVLTTPTPLGDRVHHQLARVNITSKHAAAEHQSVMAPAELRHAAEGAGFVIDHFKVFLLGGNQLCVARAAQLAA